MELPFLIRLGAVFLFAYAAVMDYRHRRAPNLVWGLIAALGVTAIGLELQHASAWVSIILGVILVELIVFAVAISAWQNGWVGGADAKAAMVLPVIFPHLPGYPFQSTVFGTLTQGIEAAVWVWIGTAIAAVWYSEVVQLDSGENGIPFLIPLFTGVLSLFTISVVVV